MKVFQSLLFFLVSSLALNGQALKVGRSYTEITAQVEIDAPIEKVWGVFADITGIYKCSPTVDTAYFASSTSKKTGIGATRHMLMSKMMKKGATLDEQCIAWNEGTYQKFEVVKIYKVAGIQTMGGDFRLESKGNKTILTSTLNYSMKNKMMGLMNNMMGKKKFSKVWMAIIAGYKHHIETGERVTADTKTDKTAVKILKIS